MESRMAAQAAARATEGDLRAIEEPLVRWDGETAPPHCFIETDLVVGGRTMEASRNRLAGSIVRSHSQAQPPRRTDAAPVHPGSRGAAKTTSPHRGCLAAPPLTGRPSTGLATNGQVKLPRSICCSNSYDD
ncbi:hypothetical protein [Streptomyces sp. NPDC020298]|uniref:hypothetical protein n=1 Tax=Streptomyces sp. NPDC020298 TaxID=3155010 RepID=UPI0033D0C95D